MRHLIGLFEYADRGGHLRPASSRGLSTSTSSHLEATSCIIWFAHITKDVLRTSTFYTSRTTTTTTEGRQVRMGEAKPHGFGLRRGLAHRRNIKGDIVASGATSTIIQLETLYSPYDTTTTSLSGKTHLQTSKWRHQSQSGKILLLQHVEAHGPR